MRPGVPRARAPVGEVDGLVDVVRDVDDRDALLLVLMEAQHEILELGARERVHRCERLVEQQDLRTRDERSRDRHALLHATGELPGYFFPTPSNPTSRSTPSTRPSFSERDSRSRRSGNMTLRVTLARERASGCSPGRRLPPRAAATRRGGRRGGRCRPSAASARRAAARAWSCHHPTDRRSREARPLGRRTSPLRVRRVLLRIALLEAGHSQDRLTHRLLRSAMRAGGALQPGRAG